MKLVMIFFVGDGCTYSYDVTLPFEYESKEKAEIDLLNLWEDYIEKLSTPGYTNPDVKFAGHMIDLTNFTYYSEKDKKTKYDEPTILTLDEWFERYKNEG